MINEKLMKIQCNIKAPKNLYNSFGKYKYRNAEGICESVKPYLLDQKCSLTLSDDVKVVSDRIYVVATATLTDIETGESTSVSAFARESLEKKGMDDSQITGTASSYARKYALNGLFLLDDTKDADTDEYHAQTHKDERIDAIKVKTIESTASKKGVDVSKIEAKFGKRLKEFSINDFKDCMDMLNKYKDKE